MKNIYMTIGHNVNGAPKWTIQNVTAAVSLTLDIDAFTALPCYGMWRGEAEESTRIEICNVTDDQAVRLPVRMTLLQNKSEKPELQAIVRLPVRMTLLQNLQEFGETRNTLGYQSE